MRCSFPLSGTAIIEKEVYFFYASLKSTPNVELGIVNIETKKPLTKGASNFFRVMP